MKNELELLNAYFKVLNYLSCACLYLQDNPLLKRELSLRDIKKKLVGHWGSAPGQNFVYAHLNRVINKYNLNMIYISGPGHSGQVQYVNSYLEGTYTKLYPEYKENEEGLKLLCKKFSFPGGTSSHAAPEIPGSINEGGELGYSLAHAYGAILDNPSLIAACVVGDGEAETGPLSASWQINKLINPLTDGAVLPILHLNGYKIANPTILSRISNEELIKYFEGMGYKPYIVSGSEPMLMHAKMAMVMDQVITEIKKIKLSKSNTPKWPLIILKTPKGWTGVKNYEKKNIEGTFRSHQVPLPVDEKHPENVKILENWLQSYEVSKYFNENGQLINELKNLIPTGNKAMSFNPNANGGLNLKELSIPDYSNYALSIDKPGMHLASDMANLGSFIREVIHLNDNIRIFGPDEALSNRLHEVFKITKRQWNAEKYDYDEYLADSGKIIDSILSEHACEGLLEGYILTGRFGFMHSYEAFIRVIDSMVSQHAKWLKLCNNISWRADIPSLNFILTSHCWQQDHNGYTHQDPGFLDHLVTKKPDIVRIYLPFDTNTLLSTFNHVITTKNYINVIVASKHERPQWLTIDEAKIHCAKGAGIIKFASDNNPDVILACAGDTPTLEVMAATQILNDNIPDLKVRVVNVVDLMKLVSNENHPHGFTNEEYNELFTKDKPIIFAFHGYPSLIHQLTYKRFNQNLHVHGYIEEGTITTPFDMRVLNKIDRYHLVIDVLKYISIDNDKKQNLIKKCEDTLNYHRKFIIENGIDIDEIINFKWHGKRP